ncbi:type II secretion system protein [Sutcliffiella rhizosphaerae]|uniref:Type II secretion system protein n=1 Tax=Sutcliffiella rhizosphaerae TaxID=2880967 RepID=A0ABM8YHK0_9BACI|nr:type II secretion system protein [Sutcliffiella rhizosphaerae]CAG9619268.1 hypothetical protein BACCIP111883_00035 [Sutcliffiella rhizosphaerae]
MWKKDSGFTLLEVLAALFVWIVIASVLVPGLVRMNQERKGFLLEQEARYILNMEQDKIRIGHQAEYPLLISKKTDYLVEFHLESQISELCVSYKEYRQNKKERCVYVHYP